MCNTWTFLHGLKLLIGILFTMTVVTSEWAAAKVSHRVTLIMDDETGMRITDDGALVEGATAGDITEPILASMAGGGFSSNGSVGPFGQLGVKAESFRTGRMVNQVIIFSDEHVNLSGVDQLAVANFIIDGGNANLLAGDGSTLELQVNLEAEINQGTNFLRRERWQGGFELEVPAGTGGNPVFRPFGEDIRATFDGDFGVDIDFSFQTFDIGVVPPGAHLELEYFLHIESEIKGFSEITRWQFSDPLAVEMGGGNIPVSSVEFVVPEPGAGILVLVALIVLAGYRLRRPS